jgi:hypothetical protein
LNILEKLFENLDNCLRKFTENNGGKQVIRSKDYSILKLNEGYCLKEIITIVKNLTEDIDIREEFKENNKIFMKYIINSVVNIRKFKNVLNHHFNAIENMLSLLFEQLQSD